MKKITLLIALMITSLGFAQSFPLNFGLPSTVLQGLGSSIQLEGVNNVCEFTGTGDFYDNAYFEMAQPIDLSDNSNNTITFRIKPINGTGSGAHAIKFETIAGGPSIEMPFTTTGTAWQTITIDFPGSLVTYDRFVIFTDFANTSVDTYRVDDFAGATNVPTGSPLTSLLLDFEAPTTMVTDGTLYSIVPNDVTTGINHSASVALIKQVNFLPFANTQHDVAAGIDLSAGNKGFSMMVKGPRATDVLFKVQGGAVSHEITGAYTTPGVWQKIKFDFSGFSSTDNNKLVFFIDPPGTANIDPAQDIFMVDYIYFSTMANLSTAKFDKSTVKMYPNPVQNSLNVEANSEIKRVSVYNVLGQEVLSASPKSNSASLPTGNLQKGVYMVTTDIDGNISTSKIIKE